MKKHLLLLGFLALAALVSGNPAINKLHVPNTADVYDLYELTFQLDRNYDNPYDPEVIDVYAEFVGPEGQRRRVIGFYYEGYQFEQKQDKKGNRYEFASRAAAADGWKIRFTPDAVGKWTFVIYAVDRTGTTRLDSYNGKAFSFDCKAKDAEGFIKKANNRYLKREAFLQGKMQEHAFFPVGPNIPWYTTIDYYSFMMPYGIYEYHRYIDSLTGNANYMRVWLTRYQYLSLYGAEHALRENGKPVVYFDSKLNQKDAAEMDDIVRYASDHGIALMTCFFTIGDFREDSEAVAKSQKHNCMPSGWQYNPYHTVLGLKRPIQFFSDERAIRVTRNLIRYIVARWGYAPNIMAWELWNEVGNVFKDETLTSKEQQAIVDWHKMMKDWIQRLDPYQHLVTTSLGTVSHVKMLAGTVFNELDIVDEHYYDNIQKAQSRGQMTRKLYEKSEAMRELYPQRLYFMGEYGLHSSTSGIDYNSRDPKGVDMHSSLWASLFSGSMGPASFWYWQALDQCGVFGRFKPMTVFSSGLPILSDDFHPATTGVIEGSSLVFPDNLQLYYLVNTLEDTLIGWCQDEAFSYQSLRRLTDKVGNDEHFVKENGILDPKGYVYTLDPDLKPRATFRGDTVRIPMEQQPRGTRYQVRWYDPETGLELTEEATEAVVRYRLLRGRHLALRFPKSLKDGVYYNNTFGDAVFVITKLPNQ